MKKFMFGFLILCFLIVSGTALASQPDRVLMHHLLGNGECQEKYVLPNQVVDNPEWELGPCPPSDNENDNTNPTVEPTDEPTNSPTDEPTSEVTQEPTVEVTIEVDPTDEPTQEVTEEPTNEPTNEVTNEPTDEPRFTPTPKPTSEFTCDLYFSLWAIPGADKGWVGSNLSNHNLLIGYRDPNHSERLLEPVVASLAPSGGTSNYFVPEQYWNSDYWFVVAGACGRLHGVQELNLLPLNQ